MMKTPETQEIVRVRPASSRSELVLVCEHASRYIPSELNALGLPDSDRSSHAAWDPGAFAVAEHMAASMEAVLVSSGVSRLVYDCNRPPEAPDAMPAQSERVSVPGNAELDAAARKARAEKYYLPFRDAVAREIAARDNPVLVTIHSFTPVYHGKQRDVEIGILHDSDRRLADAMLALAATHSVMITRRNDPYGPEDGVTHTLKEHAVRHGHLNVMIEIRNDLIQSQDQQRDVAEMLSIWVLAALARLREASNG